MATHTVWRGTDLRLPAITAIRSSRPPKTAGAQPTSGQATQARWATWAFAARMALPFAVLFRVALLLYEVPPGGLEPSWQAPSTSLLLRSNQMAGFL
ncbi:hypothetical protein VTI28DRAFT_4575 [Corynascus sepedonium]